METRHQIIVGDARRMREVEAGAVHLVITSPPYWQLKDYGKGNQIGFNDTYETYVNHLNLVWQECHRVLAPGCRLCVNIGDQFARSAYYGRYKVIPIRTEIIRFAETAGFDYMGAIIWQKVTTCNTTGGATVMGSFPHPRNGVVKIDYEFILLFKKHGKPAKVDKALKEKARMTTEEWNQYFSGHWRFAGEKQSNHLAAFPEELPRRLIRMFSFPGERVLDPFLGSGTTSVAARNLGRNSIGYEINADFLPLIENRLDDAQMDVVRPLEEDADFSGDLARLPYLFKDPLPFDRKADPRKLGFGSRIDADTSIEREDYCRVKKVLSPSLVELDNGSCLRLLGVRDRPGTARAAKAFLEAKTAGQRVFVKHDHPRHDEEGHLLGYLYLKNKTFVNFHLVRSGLVEVDAEREYKVRSRFLGLARDNSISKEGS